MKEGRVQNEAPPGETTGDSGSSVKGAQKDGNFCNWALRVAVVLGNKLEALGDLPY